MVNMIIADAVYTLQVDYVHAIKVGLLVGGITLVYYIISDIFKARKK